MKSFLSALFLLVLACSGSAAAGDRLQVVASFSILGDMVAQVTGDLADVTTIVGSDADAHLYQPNAADAKAVAGADIVFVNGLGFETWSDALINNAGGDASVFVATAGVDPILVDGETDGDACALKVYDPGFLTKTIASSRVLAKETTTLTVTLRSNEDLLSTVEGFYSSTWNQTKYKVC